MLLFEMFFGRRDETPKSLAAEVVARDSERIRQAMMRDHEPLISLDLEYEIWDGDRLKSSGVERFE